MPTSLIEAAAIQWYWLEQTGHGQDQLNSISEKLIDAWKRNLTLIEERIGHRVTVYFAVGMGDSSGEDAINTTLLMDTCQQAGWRTKSLLMEQIGLSKTDGRFYDQDGTHIDVIFKLYPWEFMVEQKFGRACFKDMDRVGQRGANGEYIGGTVWIEPPFKMMWSNKALFAVLWELFKDDPRSKWLLPTYFEKEKPASLTSYARKPIFSREGLGVKLQTEGKVLQDLTTPCYGKEGYIVQELSLPASFKDSKGESKYVVPGLWMVDGDVAGMGIREDSKPITSNFSRFVPHSISDGPVNYERSRIPDADEVEAVLQLSRYEEVEQGLDVLGFLDRVGQVEA